MRHTVRFALIVSIALLVGCATRTLSKGVINHYGLDIKLRSEKPLFGETVRRGYDHPVVISGPRLEAILRGIEIDTRKSESSAIRERRAAIHPKIIRPISEGLSEAFAQANPDQQVVVMALRKQAQKLIFDRKHLTSFVAWIDDGQLFVALSRIDWKWEPKFKNERIPEPWPGEHVMSFSVVESDVYFHESRQTVRLDWRSQAFGPAPLAEEISSRPEEGEEEGGAGAPVGTGSAAAAADTAGAEAAATAEDDDPLDKLDADDYRALADLEEARQSGAIGGAEYERRRDAILDNGN
jgi:hypothetical protein